MLAKILGEQRSTGTVVESPLKVLKTLAKPQLAYDIGYHAVVSGRLDYTTFSNQCFPDAMVAFKYDLPNTFWK